MTYEYAGRSGVLKRAVQESFANGKLVGRTEISFTDSRVAQLNGADQTKLVSDAALAESAVGASMTLTPAAYVTAAGAGCFWRTVALLAEAAAVGTGCGAVVGGIISTNGAMAALAPYLPEACALAGAHLFAAMEGWLDDCGPKQT